MTGGRYSFELHRAESGWLIHTVTVHEKWRRTPGA